MPCFKTISTCGRVVEVFGSAIAVSYAAYVGLAIERLSQPNMLATQWWLAPLVDRWPAVLYAGIPFTLILTIFIAIPASLIPVRRRVDSAAHERFWAFVKEQNEARHRPRTTESSSSAGIRPVRQKR